MLVTPVLGMGRQGETLGMGGQTTNQWAPVSVVSRPMLASDSHMHVCTCVHGLADAENIRQGSVIP